MSEFKNIGPLKLIYEKLEYCVAVQHEKFITVDDCDLDREKAVALRNWLTETIGDNGTTEQKLELILEKLQRIEDKLGITRELEIKRYQDMERQMRKYLDEPQPQ